MKAIKKSNEGSHPAFNSNFNMSKKIEPTRPVITNFRPFEIKPAIEKEQNKNRNKTPM